MLWVGLTQIKKMTPTYTERLDFYGALTCAPEMYGFDMMLVFVIGACLGLYAGYLLGKKVF